MPHPPPKPQPSPPAVVENAIRRTSDRIAEQVEALDESERMAYLEGVQGEVCELLDALYRRENGE